MRHTFQSLAVRNYRIWFVGILISNVGLWMARIAQSWLVLTVLTDNSGLAVGVTTALQFAPQLVLAPLSGFLADRFSKRTILFCTQIGLGLAAGVQAVLVLSGVVELWQIFLLAGITGMIAAIDAPSRNVFVSELVSYDKLTNAVSLNSVSFNSARLLGPAVAGLLIEWVGPGWAFAINGVSFAATVAALSMIRTGEMRHVEKVKPGSVHVRDGFVYMWHHPKLLIVVAMMFVVSALAMNTEVTIALMARVQFGRGAGDYGLLNSMMAVGALGGGLFAASSRAPRLRTLVLSTAGLGVSLAVAAASTSYILFGVVILVVGFFMIRLATGANAFIQLAAPAHLRGQVMAIYLAVFLGGSPAGAPVIGWVGDAINPPATLVLGAAGCAIAVLGAIWWALAVKATTWEQMLRGRPQWRHSLDGADDDVPVVVNEHPETGPLPVVGGRSDLIRDPITQKQARCREPTRCTR